MSKQGLGLGDAGVYFRHVSGVADGGGCAYCDGVIVVDAGFVMRDAVTDANVCPECGEKRDGRATIARWGLSEDDRQVEAGMLALGYSVAGHTQEVDRILAGADDMTTLAHCEQQARYIGILVAALRNVPDRLTALVGLMARLEERARAVGAALGETVDSDAFTTEQ